MAKFKSLREAKTFYVSDGWSIELDDEDTVIVSKQKKISHIIHAILTLLTGFLWAIVWIVLVLRNSSQRHVITFDDETKTVNIR
tara:strand:+ start:283 stop:534 length:252 start_codon:yes stop_codon:yes gene_type:complete